MAKKTKEKTLISKDLLVQNVVKGMQEKKAERIVVLNLENIDTAVADFFVICSATNDRQVDAIAKSIGDEVHKAIKEWPWHIEGKENKEWILLDYINVVAHVFNQDKREFYGLEELWGDAEITHFE
ncbi:ribosome silencing factor [Bacteroidia bacterium]|jgi:ribosome-associated protein|nr:ribosome silencing factor [Bacteroidia bacterium]